MLITSRKQESHILEVVAVIMMAEEMMVITGNVH